MADSKRGPKKRTRKRSRDTTRGKNKATAQDFTQSLTDLEKINVEANTLLVNLFVEEKGNILSEKHQRILQTLANCSVDLEPLLELVKSQTMSVEVLGELLELYTLVNTKKIDGTVVKPPSPSALLLDANRLILNDIIALRFNYFNRQQRTILQTVVEAGLPIDDLVSCIKSQKSEMLVALHVLSVVAKMEKSLPPPHAILAYLTENTEREDQSNQTLAQRSEHTISQAKRHNINLPKSKFKEVLSLYNEQMKYIKNQRRGKNNHSRLNTRIHKSHINAAQDIPTTIPSTPKARKSTENKIELKEDVSDGDQIRQNRPQNRYLRAIEERIDIVGERCYLLKTYLSQRLIHLFSRFFTLLKKRIIPLQRIILLPVPTLFSGLRKMHRPTRNRSESLEKFSQKCGAILPYLVSTLAKLSHGVSQQTQALLALIRTILSVPVSITVKGLKKIGEIISRLGHWFSEKMERLILQAQAFFSKLSVATQRTMILCLGPLRHLYLKVKVSVEAQFHKASKHPRSKKNREK